MPDDQPVLNRRDLIKGLAAAGTASIAGCQGDNSNSNNTSTTTAAPDEAPEILNYSAQPEDNGQTLIVGMEAQDDEGLEYAAVQYGDRKEERTGIEGRKIDLNGELTDLGDSELEEKPGQILYIARDTAGQETKIEEYPDETAPELVNFSAEPTENAGEIDLMLQGKDDVGLEEIKVLLGEQPQLQQNVSGQKEHSTDQTVGAPEDAKFQQNTVTVSLEDWNGNATESEAETYVRKYDLMENVRMDVGVNYYPWMGQKFGGILSRDEVRPEAGYYSDLIEQQNQLVNNHIDQMQGHGINKVMFTLGTNDKDYRRLRNYEQADLSKEIDIEAKYALPLPFRWDRDIDKDFDFIRENLFDKSNYSTVGERPIVQFWAPHHIVYSIRDEIEEEYGSLPDFVKHTRDKLTKDGVEPFLVADANGRGHAEFGRDEEFWAEWDGLTSWVGNVNPDETISQEEAMEYVRKDYEGLHRFTDKNSQDFYPMVIPGFNDTHNEEWGQNRVIPRSTSAFRQRLEMAENYADGRINIYSFNEWSEGSQIEPGVFLGNDYGTDYLEVVEGFQSRG